MNQMNWKNKFKNLKVLKPFDPFNSKLCTCPPKLSLNVYTGCGYECFYCYTSSYSFGRWGYENRNWGVKKNIIENLKKDIERLNKKEFEKYKIVTVSLSSDPYPKAKYVDEEKLKFTRNSLKILTENNFYILLQTKSTLFLRDLDILDKNKTLIGVTITTFDEKISSKIEKYAPSPFERLKAIEKAINSGFKVIVRIDPLIPEINTDLRKLEDMIKLFKNCGVKQLIFSTYKRKKDNEERFRKIFPEIEKKTRILYDYLKRINGYVYMKEDLRRKILSEIKNVCGKYRIYFSCCREGFSDLNDKICDGREVLLC